MRLEERYLGRHISKAFAAQGRLNTVQWLGTVVQCREQPGAQRGAVAASRREPHVGDEHLEWAVEWTTDANGEAQGTGESKELTWMSSRDIRTHLLPEPRKPEKAGPVGGQRDEAPAAKRARVEDNAAEVCCVPRPTPQRLRVPLRVSDCEAAATLQAGPPAEPDALVRLMRAAVVDEVPRLLPGEQRVLGQTLSVNVAPIRNLHRAWWRQKPGQRAWAEVLGERLQWWTANSLVEQLRTEIDKSIAIGDKPLQWAALPEDLPCHRDVEAFTVPHDDPRMGLRGQRGLRVKASSPALPAWTLLGPYRAHTLTREEYMISRGVEQGETGGMQYKHGSDPRFAERLKAVEPHVRELLFESFGVDFNHKTARGLRSSHTARCGSMEVKLPQDYELIASAYGFGNLMALVNDVKGPAFLNAEGGEEATSEDSASGEDEEPTAPDTGRGGRGGRGGRPPGRGRGRGRWGVNVEEAPLPRMQPPARDSGPRRNVQWVEIAVHGWPFLFMCTCREVQPGQELLISYGRNYWRHLQVLQGWTSGAGGGGDDPLGHVFMSDDDELGDGGEEGGAEPAAAEAPAAAQGATSPARAESHVTVSGLTVFMDEEDDA